MHTLVDVAVFAIRAGIGVILLLSGWSKLRKKSNFFLDAILAYDLVPRSVAKALAWVLPRLEVLLGLALLLGVYLPAVTTACYALIFMFTTAVVISLVRGRRHFCGCLGFTGEQVMEVQWQIVHRNVGLLAALLLVAASRDPYRFLGWAVEHPAPSLTLVLAGTLAAAITACAIARLHIARRPPMSRLKTN